MSSADDQYEQTNDAVGQGVPAGDSKDNDYVSRTGQSTIPVVSDQTSVEDPIDPATADSDATLGRFPFLFSKTSSLSPLACPTSPIPTCLSSWFHTDPGTARDDSEAIDKSNIIDSRTRGAAKASGAYTEPGDEEGLPTDDGTSAVAQSSS